MTRGPCRQRNFIRRLKEMSSQVRKRRRGTLNARYSVKAAHLKRLHTVRLHLYDILQKAKKPREVKIPVAAEAGRGLLRRDGQRQHRGASGSENALYDSVMMDRRHDTFVPTRSVWTLLRTTGVGCSGRVRLPRFTGWKRGVALVGGLAGGRSGREIPVSSSHILLWNETALK